MSNTEVTDSTPRCGCGKSLSMPYCDSSHGRSPEEYEAWKIATAKADEVKQIDEIQLMSMSKQGDATIFL